MKERFDIFPDLGPQAKLERLEPGIFLEVIRQEQPIEDVEEAPFVYGDLAPLETPWQKFPELAAWQSSSWKELEARLSVHGIAETHREVTLSTLADMLDAGETVFCLVNDFALAEDAAGDLPGLSGNTLLWVSGLDLRDYDSAGVRVAAPDAQSEEVPLDRFLKAWKTGSCRALSVQMEG